MRTRFEEPSTAPPSPSTRTKQPPPPAPEVKKPNTSRSRATSRAAPIVQPQPIKDAVNNAFDSSSVAQNQLDPELVRQVTEQVIRNLQSASLATPTSSVQPQQTAFAPPPKPPVQPVARSPTQSSTDSIPQRYTPPSPEKRGDGEYGSSSPEPLQSDQDSIYSLKSRRSSASTRSQETPKPTQQVDRTPGMQRTNTASSRRRGTESEERLRRRATGSDSTARDQSRPYRRDSKGSESDYYEASSSRPRPPRVPSDVIEATTLEKIWQPLFDNGNPTMRLGQFLRGLALHLIDDYEPRGTLVVTPAKMLRFFNKTKMPDEHYPWDTIFGGRLSSQSLSKMYQKLLCQHHLVQVQYHEVPSVPGLTPSGFEQLMTCLIQAHPDTEFERLANAVMNMPISNADNKSERFPKELSRRLLPAQPNLMAEQRIVASLNHEAVFVQLRGAATMPPPPPQSAPPQQTSFTERERKPYSSTPFSNAIDDDDLGQPAMPIERERKPYTAREGMGKMYGMDSDRERESRPPPTSYRPDGPPPQRRGSRSSSHVPTQATYSNSQSDPVSIPPPKTHRPSINQGPPMSMYNSMNNGMNGSLPKAGRRTPPPRNLFVRSEPFDVNGIPASQYASNLHSGYGSEMRDRYNGDPDEETSGRYRNRRPTDRSGSNGNGNGNSGDDDMNGRGYPIPPRPPPSAGFDPNYGSAGGPPVGSYPRGNGGFSMDNRRQTWYGAPNTGSTAGAGLDGYGSFANNGGGGGGYLREQQSYGSSVQH